MKIFPETPKLAEVSSLPKSYQAIFEHQPATNDHEAYVATLALMHLNLEHFQNRRAQSQPPELNEITPASLLNRVKQAFNDARQNLGENETNLRESIEIQLSAQECTFLYSGLALFIDTADAEIERMGDISAKSNRSDATAIAESMQSMMAASLNLQPAKSNTLRHPVGFSQALYIEPAKEIQIAASADQN